MSLTGIDEVLARDIAGVTALIEWFGDWPSFHDAEIHELNLVRGGISRLRVYTYNLTSKTYERDGKRFFVCEKHAMVEFALTGIVALELTGFNHQNVVDAIDLDRADDSICLTMVDCYGMSGKIYATTIAVSVFPGQIAEDSM